MEMNRLEPVSSCDMRTGVNMDSMLEVACEVMATARVDRLDVANAGKTLGFITESDILRHVSQNGGLSNTPVMALMRRIVDEEATGLCPASRPLVVEAIQPAIK